MTPFFGKTSMEPAGVPHSLSLPTRRASASLTTFSVTLFDTTFFCPQSALSKPACPNRDRLRARVRHELGLREKPYCLLWCFWFQYVGQTAILIPKDFPVRSRRVRSLCNRRRAVYIFSNFHDWYVWATRVPRDEKLGRGWVAAVATFFVAQFVL